MSKQGPHGSQKDQGNGAGENHKKQMVLGMFTCWYCDEVFTELQGLDKHHYEHYDEGNSTTDAILTRTFESNRVRKLEGRKLFLGTHLSLSHGILPSDARLERIDYKRFSTKNYLDQLERTLKASKQVCKYEVHSSDFDLALKM